MRLCEYSFNFEIPEYEPPTEKEMKNSKFVIRAVGLPGCVSKQSKIYSPPLVLERMLELYDKDRFIGGTATVHAYNIVSFGATEVYTPENLANTANKFSNRKKYGINPDGSLHHKSKSGQTVEFPKFDISVLEGLRYPIAFVTSLSYPRLSEWAKRGKQIMEVDGTARGFLVIHKDAFNEGACIIRKYTPRLMDSNVYPIVTKVNSNYSFAVYDDYSLPLKDLLYSLPVYIYTRDVALRLANPEARKKRDLTQEVIDAHNEALPLRTIT